MIQYLYMSEVHKLKYMKTKREVFECFEGEWSLKRCLGGYATAEGIAVFSYQGLNNMSYREDVVVNEVGSASSHDAYREYNYIYISCEDKISQHFPDGRLLFELEFEFENNIAHGVHMCGMDSYNATYNFKGSDEFTLKYNIFGPNKSYMITTKFLRIKR